MIRVRMLSITLFLSALTASLHIFASKYFLYWRYQWFDIPLHFLGGAAVAFMVISLVRFSPFLSDVKNEQGKIIFWKLLSIVFVVAIGWEIYDYEIYIAPLHPASYFLDTSIDIIMDILGIVFSFISNNLFFYENKK